MKSLMRQSKVERQCQLMLGICILTAVLSCTAFSVWQMDAMVLEQQRLSDRPGSADIDGTRVASPEGDPGAARAKKSFQDALRSAIHRRRAYLIAFGLFAGLPSFLGLRHTLIRWESHQDDNRE